VDSAAAAVAGASLAGSKQTFRAGDFFSCPQPQAGSYVCCVPWRAEFPYCLS